MWLISVMYIYSYRGNIRTYDMEFLTETFINVTLKHDTPF